MASSLSLRAVQRHVFCRALTQQPFTRTLTNHAVKNSTTYELRTVLLDDHGSKRKMVYVDEGKGSEGEVPIVFFGGTAMTIDSFATHITSISRSHRIIMPELRGQGRTELLSEYATMEQQVDDVSKFVEALGLKKVHLAGFSFGGRIALSVAAYRPDLVDKLSVTGICPHRPYLGKHILTSWKDAAERGNLRECGWAFVLNGYSSSFIERHHEEIPALVDAIACSNQANRLFDLIRLSHRQDACSVAPAATRVKAPTQIIAATEDRISPYYSCVELAKLVPCRDIVTLEAGHLAPLEHPHLWQKALLNFFYQQ
eukprot:scaffold1243_cov173-Ochromonas_danica.AAC.16